MRARDRSARRARGGSSTRTSARTASLAAARGGLRCGLAPALSSGVTIGDSTRAARTASSDRRRHVADRIGSEYRTHPCLPHPNVRHRRVRGKEPCHLNRRPSSQGRATGSHATGCMYHIPIPKVESIEHISSGHDETGNRAKYHEGHRCTRHAAVSTRGIAGELLSYCCVLECLTLQLRAVRPPPLPPPLDPQRAVGHHARERTRPASGAPRCHPTHTWHR